MSSFIPFDRSQPYLLPPDLKSWLPSDDVAHFIVAAVERVPLRAFSVPVRTGGKAQYHPRLMLALLIYAYANGVFSSRRIERATYRDIGMRFVAANLHPDHDTIATFRRGNRTAIEAAFMHVLLLARETGLVRLGTVSIDGTKIDANASKYRSIRYDRAKELREKLATDISTLMERAEAADTTDVDHQALPEELARREALKAKLDEACARLEAEAREQAKTARPEYERKKAAFDAKRGRRGRPPKEPDDEPPPDRQINLTDPDSKLMRRSDAHEYRQAYNAQAVVCAEGSQLILENGVVATTADAPSFAATILGMEERIGLPRTVLADTGFASGKAVETLQASGVDPLVAIGRPVNRRPYDFRPEPPPREPRRITEPWRLEMKARLQQNPAKALYALRKQTVEPVFGIIKSAMGFTRFHLRGLPNVATEWTLVALAYNCRRITRLTAA
ncbi:transposase IS1182 family protein [Gluconacetobacter diazotrophicus PA1 5]|uniref:Putative transposase n=3 Tax=Gluconacetobacter diazotrophicus TaxID=33996 RepID=A9H1J2_GLUDA|nr:IS1182-like element ISGdi13 family transposase [Gluconacetobacter diazotrophicus]ACI49970.1 transposase IS1182 family protein [Gluconacetobacter diazotrophicus PA1 5]ACI51545.1 transposase IS1182 family protein [Gluconacetobacter diazotrophicus PA1 5]ACI51600.1 transposase IS1182 family protein [Gluconacetobacter diazotrophicus PA1 5]ACI52396.1 transposase IS1182 family protein [Gluconacetobacter diazotrophicus PA1 5]ACI52448.1 transposase IS1182 family protein [Gluconacetobacter diazotroph